MNKVCPNHKKKTITIIVLLLLIVSVLFSLWFSNRHLVNTNYEIYNSKINSEIRIVHLTDFHNNDFGNNSIKLVDKVTEQKPDIVCITGDLLNMEENNMQTSENLISELCERFPVFISIGNHEKEYRYASVEEVKRRFEQSGAEVLDFTYQDISVKGTKIRIGGFYGYGMPENHEVAKEEEVVFLKKFQDTDVYKILLAHVPYAWYHEESLNYWDVDLVLAGHTHGGQIRIPVLGGLYAPDVGWFPGQECGLYFSKDQKRVLELSRGLGSSERIPRFNNAPEIVTLIVKP